VPTDLRTLGRKGCRLFHGEVQTAAPLFNSGEYNVLDAIDELVARSKSHHELHAFYKFHKKHPEVLDFLVEEIQLRLDHNFRAFSFHSLWEYARWKLEMQIGPTETFLMNDHAVPFYARAITILHPEFNGRAEFRKSTADMVFGTRLEPMPEKRPKHYARRLQWADGTAIEHGWRPARPHTANRAANRKRDIHAS
jgi:hypothetical protein